MPWHMERQRAKKQMSKHEKLTRQRMAVIKRERKERERARERDNGQKGMQSTFLCMEIIALIVARIFGLRKAQHPLQ